MPVSEAKKRADAKYRSSKRKQIQLDMSISDYERIKAHCERLDIPLATWVKGLIQAEIDGAKENN